MGEKPTGATDARSEDAGVGPGDEGDPGSGPAAGRKTPSVSTGSTSDIK